MHRDIWIIRRLTKEVYNVLCALDVTYVTLEDIRDVALFIKYLSTVLKLFRVIKQINDQKIIIPRDEIVHRDVRKNLYIMRSR